MAKSIKFDLPIDGVEVATLDDLRDHFTNDMIGHFRAGKLKEWLEVLRMTRELDALAELAFQTNGRASLMLSS